MDAVTSTFEAAEPLVAVVPLVPLGTAIVKGV